MSLDAAESHVWVSGSDVARVQVDVPGLCYHLRTWGFSWPVQCPEFTLISIGHAALVDHTDVSGLCCPPENVVVSNLGCC